MILSEATRASAPVLQENLQAYAAETGNKQFSSELKALAADKPRLEAIVQSQAQSKPPSQ